MADMMLDIETLGTKPGSVILSVGAVMFDPRGFGHGDTFYENVDATTCRAVGMITDQETANWWASPDRDEARKKFMSNKKSIAYTCAALSRFFRDNHGVCVWGHGSCFDVVLIEDAMRRVGFHETPWSFRNVRDTRTLFEYSGLDQNPPPRDGLHHHALDDAIYQAKCVQSAVNRLAGVL